MGTSPSWSRYPSQTTSAPSLSRRLSFSCRVVLRSVYQLRSESSPVVTSSYVVRHWCHVPSCPLTTLNAAKASRSLAKSDGNSTSHDRGVMLGITA